MTIRRVSASGIEELLQLPDAPQTPESPEGVPAPGEISGSRLVLSPAIAVELLKTDRPLVIRDEWGRAVAVQNAGALPWQWAEMVPYAGYPLDVLPLYVSADPVVKGTAFEIRADVPTGGPFPLRMNNDKNIEDYVFWGPATKANQSVCQFVAELDQTSPGRANLYKLRWTGSLDSYLSAPNTNEKGWLGIYPTKSLSPRLFSFHAFYVARASLVPLFQKTWPNASFIFTDYSKFKTDDLFYEALTKDIASLIWTQSGLRPSDYRAEVYDCEDFSIIYRGQAAKYGLANNLETGLAVGIIFGAQGSVRHAATVFVDYQLQVWILDYGSIVAGKDWAFQPDFIMM